MLGDAIERIHHVGSTAIPDIHAKPVIDMLAVTSDMTVVDQRSGLVGEIGYEALGEFGISGRRYFRKDDQDGIRTHQIHVFAEESPQIARHLAFRDYLIAHPAIAKDYEVLKLALAADFPHDSRRYTAGKDAFIREVDSRAAAWRSRVV